MSNYKEAKRIKNKISARVDQASDVLNRKYPEKGRMGMTPEYIRKSPSYVADKLEFDLAFKKLREFNKFFVKTFKKEIRADRAKRYK